MNLKQVHFYRQSKHAQELLEHQLYLLTKVFYITACSVIVMCDATDFLFNTK